METPCVSTPIELPVQSSKPLWFVFARSPWAPDRHFICLKMYNDRSSAFRYAKKHFMEFPGFGQHYVCSGFVAPLGSMEVVFYA